MLDYSFFFTVHYHGKANNKTHSRKKTLFASQNSTSHLHWGRMNVRRRLVISFSARLFSHSMNPNRHKKPRHNQISVGSYSGVPRSWTGLSLTLLYWLSWGRQSSYWLAGQSTTVITPPYLFLPPIWQLHFHYSVLLMSCSLRVWILISFVWIYER